MEVLSSNFVSGRYFIFSISNYNASGSKVKNRIRLFKQVFKILILFCEKIIFLAQIDHANIFLYPLTTDITPVAQT